MSMFLQPQHDTFRFKKSLGCILFYSCLDLLTMSHSSVFKPNGIFVLKTKGWWRRAEGHKEREMFGNKPKNQLQDDPPGNPTVNIFDFALMILDISHCNELPLEVSCEFNAHHTFQICNKNKMHCLMLVSAVRFAAPVLQKLKFEPQANIDPLCVMLVLDENDFSKRWRTGDSQHWRSLRKNTVKNKD